jgi:hypothetical protein
MKFGLNDEHAKQHACEYGLILDGFTVEADHSIALCEQGREWTYSKKRPEQRKQSERDARWDKRGVV